LAVDPRNPGRVFAATPGGVWLTSDGGGTWRRVCAGRFSAVGLYPPQPDSILAGGSAGVMLSEDGGENWAPMNDGLGSARVTCLGFVGVSGRFPLVGTRNRACYVWRSPAAVQEPPAARDRPAEFRALPAVATSRVTFRLPAGTRTVRILDAAGRLVIAHSAFDIRHSSFVIDLVSLPAGVYVAEATGTNVTSHAAFTVVR
ncbi:MAG: hypothetical protein R6X13_10700, partial [bacterium]